MNEKWSEIYGKDATREFQAIQHPVDSYAEPQRTSGIARIATPTCDQHCSGRHEIDGKMVCPKCKGVGYLVTLHEYPHMEGHYFTTLEPINGSPQWGSLTTPICRDCGCEFERE